MVFIIRDVMRMILALGIAFYFQRYFFSDAYWLILSVFFGVALGRQLLLTASVASIIVLVANLFSYSIVLYTLFLLLITYFSVSFGYEQRKYWQHAFVFGLYAVLAGVLLTNFTGSLMRFKEIWLGFFIAWLVRLILFIRTDTIKKELIKDILLTSNAYLQNLFVAMLRRDYQTNSETHEKTFHSCRLLLMKKLGVLHNILQQSTQSNYHEIETQLQKLYENILALGNILLRIDDVAIFEMASKEFIGMAEACDEILKSLAHFKNPSKLDSLSYYIQQLQDVNASGVQLIIKDPLVFFLFIEDWKLLERRFELISSVFPERTMHAANEKNATSSK